MIVTRKGNEVELVGVQPKVGEKAPDFTLKNLEDKAITLSALEGKTVLISVVPDIDTRICSIQTKRFNQEAGTSEGVVFLTISNNTKEEQSNWCAAEGVDMEMLRDTENSFGEAYGLFIPEMGRLARAIFVVDKEGTLAYEKISREISEEPNYAEALEQAKALS
ncbi:thiol peroxidase [Enterococcus sp. BWB1-3]|uniref:thiol peroxidase n=1 Tax=unclassified Enterococcus TaxID=2608891 RepID=UPI00192441D0|nr:MULTISPECIES: thiol peroxidase [unclassified Enterococcus]MBL1228876.1 thiol peroxidase [Enterococcus sp. BWB1-3]MCB5954673.1 thiol peroxidase [Enterococcus sp. CWB-B31]